MVAEEAAVNRGAVDGKHVRSVDWLCLTGTWKRESGEAAVEGRLENMVIVCNLRCMEIRGTEQTNASEYNCMRFY